MMIDGYILKEGDQILYRDHVATFEGDHLDSFALTHEDDYVNVLSFPWSLETIFEHVDEEFKEPASNPRKYQLVVF